MATPDITSTRKHVDERITKAEEKEYFTLLIYDNKTEKIIGIISLKDIDWRIPKCEIAYFIDNRHEGKGIVTKSVSKVIEYCFETLNFNKIFARIEETNNRSRRVLEKNGFVQEGFMRCDYKNIEGELVDVMYWRLIRKKSF